MARTALVAAAVLSLMCLAVRTDGATVASTASANPDFSVLVAALEAAGLTATLNDPTLVSTVFAPTDAAFEKLLASMGITQEELLASPILGNVLRYHVVPGVAATASDLTNGQMLPTLLGEDLAVDLTTPGTVMIKGSKSAATVVTPDIVADQSIIHVIDEVLMPTTTTA